MKLTIIIILIIVSQISAKVHRTKRAKQGNNYSYFNMMQLTKNFQNYAVKNAMPMMKRDLVKGGLEAVFGNYSEVKGLSDDSCGNENEAMNKASDWRGENKPITGWRKKFRGSPVPPSAEDSKITDCLADVISSNSDIVSKLGDASNNFQTKIASVKDDVFPGLLQTYKSDIEKIDPNLAVTNKMKACLPAKKCKVKK